MTSHAACSPSSAAMWIGCPASVTQTAGMDRPSSKYAREGTAAHAVAEMILRGDPILPDKVTVEGSEFIVSREMCRALNPYVTYVQRLMKSRHSTVELEQRLQIPGTEGLVWGTLDCGALIRNYIKPLDMYSGLVVADLKFGKGVAVEPDSPQLKLYAIGFAARLNINHTAMPVTLTVVQPRVGDDPVRSCKTTMGALWDWSDRVVRPAVLRIADGDTTEVAGHWCRWCVRQTACKAFAGRHQKHAAAAFDD